ncbi:MAG: S46 family peptidase [Planctomycetota bacterium]
MSSALAAQTAPPAGKMWLLEEPPLEHIRQTYGVELTPEWLEKTRLSGLRFGGGTGSFVSAEGLVLTNHHVVRGNLSQMEHEGKNLGLVGYVARSREQELQIPGASVNQLVEVQDVTDEVFAGVDLSDTIEAVQAKLAERRRAVLAKAAKTWPKLTPQLVTLYRGARVHLYLYRAYSDVRIVFAPELQLGYFGGDTDNFRYPRYALDFSLCRVYDNGKPLDTSANHFTFSSGKLAEDAVVFSLGNPGSTDRMLTVAELEYRRDALYPAQTATTDVFLDALEAYAKDHAKDADRLRELAFGIANGNKATLGHLEGLRDAARMSGRRAVEQEQRQRLASAATLEASFGDAWDEIDLALEELVPVYQRWWHLMPWYGQGQWFRPLTRALSVVEDFHPDFLDEDRFPFPASEFTYPFEPEVYAAHLARGREVLGADDPAIAALLRGAEPAEAVNALLAETKIGTREFVEELRAGGWEALEACEDPAVVAARTLYPLLVDAEDQKKLLDSVVAHQGLRVGKAIDGLEGPLVCPEATFSQRLSAGRVRAYLENGQAIPAMTRIAGLYERCAQFGDQGEFDLPDLWFERKDALDLATPMNFVCTVDSTGGSSGSPLFDAERRILGVLFDGNLQATQNEFVYQDDEARAVALCSDAMLAALEHVYQAPHLAAELRGEAQAAPGR